MSERRPYKSHGVCKVCPARLFGYGEFNVESDIQTHCPSSDGYRINSSGFPTCIHPDKVGIPEGEYIHGTEKVSFSSQSGFPESNEGLVQLMTECIETVDPGDLHDSLDEIERLALEHGFSDETVVECLRRSMSLVNG